MPKMKLRAQRDRIRGLTMGTCVSMIGKNEVLPPKQVRTTGGVLEGRRHRTKAGFESDCFLGIPYAKPPVGELRFKKPVPPTPWTGVRSCRRFGARSIQHDMFWDKFTIHVPQSEDCLYLNVFAPAIDPAKKYPVMFYIHGGGFMMDSAVRYTPENVTRLLVSRGIVVVTIQYRLGYLGYLSTGDDAARGNFGLWDQLEALKWTKENIHQFGGDPNQITVAGQSAGAVSTDLLSLSPLSRDMFQRKIVMGASSFCHWAVTEQHEINEYCRKKAIKLGWKPRKQGYPSTLEENNDMVEFLRKVPASKFATHMIGCKTVFSEARLPLAPVIDGEILPERIEKLRESAPAKESIVGVGQQESLLFVALGAMRCNGKDMDRVMETISKKAREMGNKEVEDIVRKIYGDVTFSKSNKKEAQQKFVTLLSDVISNYACYRYLVHSQSHGRPCFAYSFDYTSKRMWGWLSAMIPFMAGTHASEIIYLFDCNYFTAPLPMTSQDRIVSDDTSNRFAQFVKNGNPNPEDHSVKVAPVWSPLDKNGELEVFSFSEQPKMKNKVFDRMSRFDELMADFRCKSCC